VDRRMDTSSRNLGPKPNLRRISKRVSEKLWTLTPNQTVVQTTTGIAYFRNVIVSCTGPFVHVMSVRFALMSTLRFVIHQIIEFHCVSKI
jgi:hypothetical protein